MTDTKLGASTDDHQDAAQAQVGQRLVEKRWVKGRARWVTLTTRNVWEMSRIDEVRIDAKSPRQGGRAAEEFLVPPVPPSAD